MHLIWEMKLKLVVVALRTNLKLDINREWHNTKLILQSAKWTVTIQKDYCSIELSNIVIALSNYFQNKFM